MAVTTLSGPLIIQAEFVVNTKFALVGSAARVQRRPGKVVAALNNLAKVPCLAWNSGVNNTRQTCRRTLSLSHDYVIGPIALPRLNLANLSNSCHNSWLHCGEPVCTSRSALLTHSRGDAQQPAHCQGHAPADIVSKLVFPQV